MRSTLDAAVGNETPSERRARLQREHEEEKAAKRARDDRDARNIGIVILVLVALAIIHLLGELYSWASSFLSNLLGGA